MMARYVLYKKCDEFFSELRRMPSSLWVPGMAPPPGWGEHSCPPPSVRPLPGNASSRQEVFIFFPTSFLLLPIFTSCGSSQTCAVIQHGILALGRLVAATWGLQLFSPGWSCSYMPPLRHRKPAAWPP